MLVRKRGAWFALPRTLSPAHACDMTGCPDSWRKRCRGWAVAGLFGAALFAGGCEAVAQRGAPRIWDIPLGTPVQDLPAREFVDPACGTDGGPRGRPIGSFDKFDLCPQDANGLREIWFIYDDTAEYVARARRDPSANTATAILDQPVVLSFLIDRDGRVAGYRIFTDPRAEPALRVLAYQVSFAFKARFDLDGHCADQPRGDRETPIDGLF